MRATTELTDQHATLELIGGLLMSSDEEPLPGCFQRAHSASWLKNKSAASEKYQTACGVLSGKYPSYPQGGADPNGNGRADARRRANRPRRVYSVEHELEGSADAQGSERVKIKAATTKSMPKSINEIYAEEHQQSAASGK